MQGPLPYVYSKILLFCLLFSCQHSGYAQDNPLHKFPFPYVPMVASGEWVPAAFDHRIVDSIGIVGIGEVTHGAQEPSSIKATVVKYLIDKRGFRKLLFEYPNASLAVLNYYLTEGKFKSTDTLYMLTAATRAGSFTDRSFFELMQWLKQYNLNHPEDMVQLKGFDISGASESFAHYFRLNFNELLDSVTRLNVDSAMREGGNVNNASRLIIEWFYKNQDAVRERLKKYYPDLLYNVKNAGLALEHNERQNINFYGAAAFRDSIMAANINEQSRDVKSVAWAHNLHITTADHAVSMGNYLRKVRQDYYTIITDFTGPGRIYAVTENKKVITRVIFPSKKTAACKLADKYKLPAGVVFFKDLVLMKKTGTLFNAVDKFGNNIVLGKGHGFDAMILSDSLTPAAAFPVNVQK